MPSFYPFKLHPSFSRRSFLIYFGLAPNGSILKKRHVDLDGGILGFYHPDQIHLSDIALDIFNMDLQSCVELAFGRLLNIIYSYL